MRQFFFLILSIMMGQSIAMEKSFKTGESEASKRLEQMQTDIMKVNPSQVPGFKTATPPQSSLTADTMEEAVAHEVSQNKAAQFVKESSDKRPTFKIDGDKDPLFISANKVANNPEGTLGVTVHTKASGAKKVQYTCTKGYETYEKKCRWTKVPVKTGVRYEEEEYIVNLSRAITHQLYRWPSPIDILQEAAWGLTTPFDIERSIEAFKQIFRGYDEATKEPINLDTDSISRIYWLGHHGKGIDLGDHKNYWPEFIKVRVKTKKEIPTFELKDTNTCENLELLADRGECGYGPKRCIEGPETRMIEGTPVYADCWAEEATYQCHSPYQDNCKKYLEKGCYQLNSRCKVSQDNTCVQWEQTFECLESPSQSHATYMTGNKAFCMDGNCVDSSYVANTELLQALSQMSVLKQIQDDLRKNLGIFKGDSLECSRNCAGFKDCCGNGRGWGVSLKLGNCDANEVKLSKLRQENKCVAVGTYCAKRVLGVCTSKRSSFCCFGTKLSRLIQEQGRSQLGISFGSAEHPQCRGLTPEELSQIDMSKMDLSELFEDIKKNFKPQNPSEIKSSVNVDRIKQNMSNLVSGTSRNNQ